MTTCLSLSLSLSHPAPLPLCVSLFLPPSLRLPLSLSMLRQLHNGTASILQHNGYKVVRAEGGKSDSASADLDFFGGDRRHFPHLYDRLKIKAFSHGCSTGLRRDVLKKDCHRAAIVISWHGMVRPSAGSCVCDVRCAMLKAGLHLPRTPGY